ncbi:hypothetical protein AAFP35_25840 [Gordonia sp. CPCC 206044]|uniref:hypothetical protein n=1 Tax=Gordonia sp. CPCC 206044 TaxID=3140793 RepID=UPI003AF3DB98
MLIDRHGARVAYTEVIGSIGITTAYDKHGTVLDQIHVEADANPPMGIAQLLRDQQDRGMQRSPDEDRTDS